MLSQPSKARQVEPPGHPVPQVRALPGPWAHPLCQLSPPVLTDAQGGDPAKSQVSGLGPVDMTRSSRDGSLPGTLVEAAWGCPAQTHWRRERFSVPIGPLPPSILCLHLLNCLRLIVPPGAAPVYLPMCVCVYARTHVCMHHLPTCFPEQ